MWKLTNIALTVLLALTALASVDAHVGRGMPVHHHLQPRLGQTTDRTLPVRIYRRSTPHDNARRSEYLHDSIQDNIRRASAADNHPLPALDRRQSSTNFGGSTSGGSSAQAAEHGTTEAQSVSLTDSSSECTRYNLPIMGAIKSQFPAVWTVGDLLDGDSEALALLQSINSSGLIPTDIGVRGTQPSSLNGTALAGTYPLAEDPDCWWTDRMCTQPKHPGLLPDITTCNEPQTWGYTFDDGPNCTHNALYDLWAANNQKASLMYIGSNVFDWPLEAQRGIVDGHHICVHTWSHRYMTALTTNQAFAELWYTMKAIKYVMGVTPTCWRPPYGDVDDRIRAIAQGLGLRTIMWNTDTNDWNIEPFGAIPTPSMQATYSSIIAMATQPAAATGGIIVLEHELEQSAMNMSMQQYPAVKAAWKHVVPLTACLNVTKPYAEDIAYPDFEEYTGGDVEPSGLPGGSMSISSTAAVSAQTTLSVTGYTPSTQGMTSSASVESAASSASSSSSSSSSQQQQSSHSNAAPLALAVFPSVLVGAYAMLCVLLILN